MSSKEATEGLPERTEAVIIAINLSKREIGRLVGVSGAFVSAICRGESQPSIKFIAGLREKFNVNLDWLLLARGSMFVEGSPLEMVREPDPPEEEPEEMLLLRELLARADAGVRGEIRGYLRRSVEIAAREPVARIDINRRHAAVRY